VAKTPEEIKEAKIYKAAHLAFKETRLSVLKRSRITNEVVDISQGDWDKITWLRKKDVNAPPSAMKQVDIPSRARWACSFQYDEGMPKGMLVKATKEQTAKKRAVSCRFGDCGYLGGNRDWAGYHFRYHHSKEGLVCSWCEQVGVLNVQALREHLKICREFLGGKWEFSR